VPIRVEEGHEVPPSVALFTLRRRIHERHTSNPEDLSDSHDRQGPGLERAEEAFRARREAATIDRSMARAQQILQAIAELYERYGARNVEGIHLGRPANQAPEAAF